MVEITATSNVRLSDPNIWFWYLIIMLIMGPTHYQINLAWVKIIAWSLRGVIFKIQPLRNPSIFNNMICVPISKVLLKGMSNHPHFEISGLRQKFDTSGFFLKIQNFMWEKIIAGVINGLSIDKNFDEIFFPKFQNFHVKNGSSVKWKKKSKHYLPIVSWK